MQAENPLDSYDGVSSTAIPLAVEQLCPGNTGPTPSPEALSIAPLLEMKDPALSPRHGGSGGGSSPKIS